MKKRIASAICRDNRIFKGKRIHIVEKGIPSVQLRVIKERILENGGVLDGKPISATHVVTSLAPGKAIPLLGETAKHAAKLHTLEWITESLRRGEICRDDEFLLGAPAPAPQPAPQPTPQPAPQPTPAIAAGSVASGMKPPVPKKQRTAQDEEEFDWRPDDALDSSPEKTPARKKKPDQTKSIGGDGNVAWLSLPIGGGTDSEEEVDFSSQKSTRDGPDGAPTTAAVSIGLMTPLRRVLTKDRIADLGDGVSSPLRSPVLSGDEGEKSQPPDEPQRSPGIVPPDGNFADGGDFSDHHRTESEEDMPSPRKRGPVTVAAADTALPKANKNAVLTDGLYRLSAAYKTSGDRWRSITYWRAATAISSLDFDVERPSQVEDIPGCGASVMKQVAEILEQGKSLKAERYLDTEHSRTIALFSKVHGAGTETARRWYIQGFRTLEDLARADLSRAQRLGLQFFNEFQQRIPREEVSRIESVVMESIGSVSRNLRAVTCGSFRRMKATCGDVDILITSLDPAVALGDVLPRLVRALHERELLTEDLTTSWEDRYMGVCVVSPPGVHRRIDFKVVPQNEWAFALLHSTGSGPFNQSLRLLARRNGFTLGEHSMSRAEGYGKQLIKIGEPLQATTEEEIFKLLGLPYYPPNQREDPLVVPPAPRGPKSKT